MDAPDLSTQLTTRRATIGVIGLGYVGLAAAATFAEAGFNVRGVDTNAARAAAITAGRNPVRGREPGLDDLIASSAASGRLQAGSDYALLRDCDVVLIDVETPIDANHQPRYDALRAACTNLGPVLKPGALVIVESTLAPGTMQGVVRPLLEASTRRQVHDGFWLGHCPERLTAGKLLHNLRTLSRVCGAETPATRRAMRALYETVVYGEIDTVDWLTAELVKTGENAYRDVNIAFANELGRICEQLGGNFWQVRALINKLPDYALLMAGAGVGGHCLPKDPWLLLANLPDGDFEPRLIPTARTVNDHMPEHVVGLIARALARHRIALHGACVALLGYSYLADSDDTRNSPSVVVADLLRAQGTEVRIHDPYVPGYDGPLEPVVTGADVLVILVAHSAYRSMNLAQLYGLIRTPILVDGRGVCTPEAAAAAGFELSAVGIGPLA